MIYVCIPAHNEERTIGVLLWKIRQVLADFPRDYQILVANDGSTDSTAEVLEPYQRVLPLTVISTKQKRGFATSLELLLREAVRRAEYPKRDVIVTMQADFTDDPDVLALLLKRIEAGADIVCANPEQQQAAPRGQRWVRGLGNLLLKRRRWPEGVTDPLSGYRAYRVLVVKKALEERNGRRLLTWEGWPASAELLQLVQPYSRRTEAVSTIHRRDRQQRATRRSFWEALPGLLGFARGGSGPLSASVLEVADSTVDSRDRPRERSVRGPAREQQSRERPSRDPRGRRERKEREPRAQSERPTGERKQGRAQPRPQNAQAAQNGSAPALEESGLPARKKRRRRKRKAIGPAAETMITVPEAAQLEVETTDVGAAEMTAVETPREGARRRRSRRGRGRRGRRGARQNEAQLNDASAVNPASNLPDIAQETAPPAEPGGN